ncbi:MAG: hypothetical protein P4L87_16805 [Formivibrio sp.]|nr:hypothetical protein [Formivibrio sp.]
MNEPKPTTADINQWLEKHLVTLMTRMPLATIAKENHTTPEEVEKVIRKPFKLYKEGALLCIGRYVSDQPIIFRPVEGDTGKPGTTVGIG